MALEHLPDQFESRSDTKEWRSSDFPCLEILELWLSSHGLDAPHDEAEPNRVGHYQHLGYKAVSCRVCHQPTIVGIESSDVSCGRPACDVGLIRGESPGDGS